MFPNRIIYKIIFVKNIVKKFDKAKTACYDMDTTEYF